MTGIDATMPTIDAMDESISDSMTRFRRADDGASTRLPRWALNGARSVRRQRKHDAKTKGFRGIEMIAFDATKPTINASAPLMFALSTLNRAPSEVAITLLHRHASNGAGADGALRDALEGDDRQVLSPAAVHNAQLKNVSSF